MQLYAIVRSEGKEYRVVPGQRVKIDRVQAEPGEAIEFDQVCRLVEGDRTVDGQPMVAGARVRAHVVKHGQDEGIIVFRMNRRRLYHNKYDRGWQFTVLDIDEIVFGDDVFDKRHLDRRKIKKAEAARTRAARRSGVPPRPEPQVPPALPAEKEIIAEAVPIPVAPSATKSPTAQTQAERPSYGKWLGIAGVLGLLAIVLLLWHRAQSPAAPSALNQDASSAPADVRLLKTRAAGHPGSPTQPPD